MNIRKRLILSFTLCGITPIILVSAVNMAISSHGNQAIRYAVENDLSSDDVVAVSEQAAHTALLSSTCIMIVAGLIVTMYAYNTVNALMLEPKADMKRRRIPSPDVADAFALTFAYPVARWEEEDEPTPDLGRSLAGGY